MITTKPITTIIQKRYSCRNYALTSLDDQVISTLAGYIEQLPPGPFGSRSRFQLAAASGKSRNELRGLHTYGAIKNPPAFIIGASKEGPLTLEDFGYCMEEIILFATSLGLGTCWLGGTFTRSAFAHRFAAQKNEILPAVVSLGYPAEENLALRKVVEQMVIQPNRLAWEALFFDDHFGQPLSMENSGDYRHALEMVHLAPSASNKQPWRILKQDHSWHFYLQRSRGYRQIALGHVTGIADMQRIDMGIAMSHFELAAREAALAGRWEIRDPMLEKPDALTSYLVTWKAG